MSFAITAAKQLVNMDAARKGEASFTVTNTTDRPLRGQLKVKPLEKSPASWFSLSGDAEREFSPKGTQQVGVKIQVPAEVAPGKYTFRLDAVSAANPDDDFTEGQTVAVDVPGAAVPPKKPFPWWIVAVAAAVLVVLGVVIWAVAGRGGQKVNVPKVVGLSLSDAQNALGAVGLKDTEKGGATSGTVSSQDPAANSPVSSGSTVTLTLATKLSVPDVTTMVVTEAKKVLNGAGFKEKIEGSSAADAVVSSETPPPGSSANQGDTITLLVKAPSPTLVTAVTKYESGQRPSGRCAAYSPWYTLCSGNEPAGWTIVSHNFSLGGDRSCTTGWAECNQTANSRTSVCYQFRMQGHSEQCNHPGNTGIQYSHAQLDVTWQHPQ